MSNLEIHLLGPPQIRHAGTPLSFRSAKALALLVYLAVEGDVQSRETLAALFWPESDGSRARANLRNTLNYLRDALPRTEDGTSPHLIVKRDALGFNGRSNHFIDTAVVENAETTRRPEPMARALSLYRGDFLEGFSPGGAPAFDDWATFQRERWHRGLGTIFRRLAHYQAENGRVAAALETASQWLAHDPLDEAAHRQMMQLLARDGRRHDALAQYERCRALLEEALGVEPEPLTTTLFEQIRSGDQGAHPHHMAPTRRHNLPSPDTHFFGREEEQAVLRECLDGRETRLVTLIGPGGIGKTRLALQVARESVGRFLDGVWLIALEETQDTQHLVAALAGALGLQLTGQVEPRRQLLAFLRKRETLLVLDNFEQLLPQGAAFLASLLREAPGVEILVTSRERLNLRSEQVVALDGLPPRTARELFVAAARRADAAFALKPEMEPAVSRIGELVGGLPLGLELAGAWVRVLSPAAIAAELQENHHLVAQRLHDLPPRHRSLRAVFDTSWQRLRPEEQTHLRQLSLFHGGFTRGAAEAVAGVTLPLLSALVDKSLVSRQAEERFALHPLFREYAAEKLAAHPQEQEAAAHRHRTYYAAWLSRQETILLQGARSDEAIFHEIEADLDNVRAAWQKALAQNAAHTLGAAALPLGIYYDLRGPLQEWRPLLDAAIAQLEAAPSLSPAQKEAVGRLLMLRGLVASRRGDQAQASNLLQDACARLAGAPALEGMALNYLAIATLQEGHFLEARALAEEALALSESGESALGVGLAYNVLGITAGASGNAVRARQYLKRAVAQWRTVQSKHGEGRALIHLGHVTIALGELDRAKELLQRALSLGEQINDRTLRPLALGHLGLVNDRQGRFRAARRHFSTALEESAAHGLLPHMLYAIGGLGLVAGRTGNEEMAVTLLTFFLNHPHGLPDLLLGQPQQLLDELKETLSPFAWTAAQAHTQTLTLDAVAAQLRTDGALRGQRTR